MLGTLSFWHFVHLICIMFGKLIKNGHIFRTDAGSDSRYSDRGGCTTNTGGYGYGWAESLPDTPATRGCGAHERSNVHVHTKNRKKFSQHVANVGEKFSKHLTAKAPRNGRFTLNPQKSNHLFMRID